MKFILFGQAKVHFNTWNPIIVIHRIKNMKGKNKCRKSVGKFNSHLQKKFLNIKPPGKLGIEGIFLDLLKCIYK